MKPLNKNEMGELVAAIHSLGKDKVRELALLMWQHIHELKAANYPETPEGWKLLPLQPTAEMEKAISDGIYNDLHTAGIYAELLASAPTPSVTDK